MKPLDNATLATPRRTNALPIALLALIVCGGAAVRLVGLGGRSLWADEFCTWHVSRMQLGESLEWGPELTKPPLYQLGLRLFTDDPRPDEWLLRMPAAIASILTILAAFALAHRGGGWMTGCAAAGLVAFNLLQIAYGQEARPYSFFALGATVSTLLWWRLVLTPTRLFAAAYALCVILTFHSHYLSLLVFGAHATWWIFVSWRRKNWKNFTAPAALAVAGVCCVPVVINYIRLKTSTFQGLDWIQPPTISTALSVLSELTFGTVWVVGLAVALAWWAWSCRTTRSKTATDDPTDRTPGTSADIVGLLLFWLVFSWFGLLVLSWIAHPAMVARYALSSAIPALLIPIIVAGRCRRELPLVLLVIFTAVGISQWKDQRLVFDSGFRELSAFLAETVDPQRDLVVLTIDRQTHPDWIDAERLPFDYYPIAGAEIGELHLDPDGKTVLNDVLEDPRQIYLIVLWADPFPVLEAAGRKSLPFDIDGQEYSRLLFTPYRLIRVAAKE